MFERIGSWLSKKPQTKASYIGAIAGLLSAFVTLIAVGVAIRESRLSHRLADRAQSEQVRIVFKGGWVCQNDYHSQFSIDRSERSVDKVILPTRWPVILTNIGQSTVSIVGHNASARLRGEHRNIRTTLLHEDGTRIAPPIAIAAGESVKLFLGVPIRIPTEIYKLVETSPEFKSTFTPAELESFLARKYSLDIYGNRLRVCTKTGGKGPNRLLTHFFALDDAGGLTQRGHQADQVTIDFQTARDNFISGRAFYYEQGTAFSIQVPRGWEDWERAEISFTTEEVDSFPTITDVDKPSR